MKRLESKLPAVGTTIFTVMTQLANEHGAVNLSQGFPNFEPPAGLIERVEHYLGTRCHQYAPMPGSVPFTMMLRFGPVRANIPLKSSRSLILMLERATTAIVEPPPVMMGEAVYKGVAL